MAVALLDLDVWPGVQHGLLYEVWAKRRRQRQGRLPHIFARQTANGLNEVEASCHSPLPPLAGDGVPCANYGKCDASSSGALTDLACLPSLAGVRDGPCVGGRMTDPLCDDTGDVQVVREWDDTLECMFGSDDEANMQATLPAEHLPRNEVDFILEIGFADPVPEPPDPAVPDKLPSDSCFQFMCDDNRQFKTFNVDNCSAVNSSVISYNLANAQSYDRLTDVISVLKTKKVMIGMLQSTCRRLVDTKRGFDVLDVDGYRCVSFGHSGDWHAGCMICISLEAFPECDWKRIWVPSCPKTRGRIGLVRLKRCDFDVCFISAYVPPVDKKGSIRQVVFDVYSETSNAVSCRQVCPHRSIPILGIDANGHVGKEFRRDSRERVFKNSDSIGTEDAEKENRMGSVFRRFLEDLGFCCVNSFFQAGKTFY